MHKIGDVDLIGMIASHDYVIKHHQQPAISIKDDGSIEYAIQIISTTPQDFPTIDLVWGYSQDLKPYGFLDEHFPNNQNKRIHALQSFLADRLILFNIHQQMTLSYPRQYLATNIRLQPKITSGHHLFYHPLPVFSEKTHHYTYQDFLQKLINPSYLGSINKLSTALHDTPRYILWRRDDETFEVFGEFHQHHYASEGFRLYSSNLRQAKLSEALLDNTLQWPRNETLLFMEQKSYRKLKHLLNQSPLIKTKPIYSPDRENELLDQFTQSAKNNGFLYDEKDLINFHTAMKSSNLVILAGMSGTGKSKLVEIYAQALGLSHDQLKIIPVRPSWTNDSDLIGFVDLINMRYRPSDSGLVDLMINAAKGDKLYIVCFDEMNLARVEHYFSPFLSLLEMESKNRQLTLYNHELSSQLKNADVYPPTIPLGDNLLFVGTVNLDETTYHFSDKVLDRANVITLNTDLSFQSLANLKKEQRNPSLNQKIFDLADYQSFHRYDHQLQLKNREIECLQVIHDQLQKVNPHLGVGYRIFHQIDIYLKNLPLRSNYQRSEAFDYQIAQRILTKLRGSEDQLKFLLGDFDIESGEVKNSHLLHCFDIFSDISFFHKSKQITMNKSKEIRIHGYTI